MENRLGYSVIRNFDYSQSFTEGVVNQGREEQHSPHILSKTCLDLFLPSSDASTITTLESNGIRDRDRKEEEAVTASKHSVDGVGELGGNTDVSRSKGQTIEVGTEQLKRQDITPDKTGGQRSKDGERSERPHPPPPLVVFAYGGGWRRGDKQTWRHYISRWECNFSLAALVGCDRLYSNIGESFASRGFPCAVLSYPIAPTPPLLHLIEMGISLSYALAYYILTALLLYFVLEVLLRCYGHLEVHSGVPALPLTGAVLIVTQWITLAIMISRELYLDKQHQTEVKGAMSRKMPIIIALLAIITTVSALDMITLTENNTLALSISGIQVFAVQCLIFYYRQTTTSDLGPNLVVGPKSQAESVALALRWLVDYGRSTAHFDPDSIILMGHSAGGHLVSLVALDHHYLADVGISPRVIKGVITLSAVHDLKSISKGFFYHVYLKPAFGTDPAYWTTMSPVEYVKLLDEHGYPTPNSTQSSSSSSSSSQMSSSSPSLPLPPAAASSTPSSSASPPPPPPSHSSSSSQMSSSSPSLPLPPAAASSTPSSSAPPPPSSSHSSSTSSSPVSPPPISSSHSSSPALQISSLLPRSSSSTSTKLQQQKSSSLSPPPSQQATSYSKSSSTTQTPSAPHRPHFLILSPAQDFQFMIKDADKMYSILRRNGYKAKRNLIKGCSHFNMVRKFGCPWYRYWTGFLRKSGGWVPSDGEMICWEFVQQFWMKEKHFLPPLPDCNMSS